MKAIDRANTALEAMRMLNKKKGWEAANVLIKVIYPFITQGASLDHLKGQRRAYPVVFGKCVRKLMVFIAAHQNEIYFPVIYYSEEHFTKLFFEGNEPLIATSERERGITIQFAGGAGTGQSTLMKAIGDEKPTILVTTPSGIPNEAFEKAIKAFKDLDVSFVKAAGALPVPNSLIVERPPTLDEIPMSVEKTPKGSRPKFSGENCASRLLNKLFGN